MPLASPPAALALIGALSLVPPVPCAAPSPGERAAALSRYGLDPETPLEARIGSAPATVLKMFEDGGETPPIPHVLTAVERGALADAFARLPPLHRRILGERLRRVSVLDGMPNTALTSTVNMDEPYRLFDLTIRATIFDETVSAFLTNKERSCFDATGSTITVSVEAVSLPAIDYVRLHLGTHMVESSLGLTPKVGSDGTILDASHPATPFTDGIWTGPLTPAPVYGTQLAARVRFYPGGKVLPAVQARGVYAALRRTPFASLYGSANWFDDLAEYVALSHWTGKLGQPYRIVVRDGGQELFAYEPMASALVRRRLDQMAQFYEEGR